MWTYNYEPYIAHKADPDRIKKRLDSLDAQESRLNARAERNATRNARSTANYNVHTARANKAQTKLATGKGNKVIQTVIASQNTKAANRNARQMARQEVVKNVTARQQVRVDRRQERLGKRYVKAMG